MRPRPAGGEPWVAADPSKTSPKVKTPRGEPRGGVSERRHLTNLFSSMSAGHHIVTSTGLKGRDPSAWGIAPGMQAPSKPSPVGARSDPMS